MPEAPALLLYDHRSSICSQMARLALVEKGLPFERRSIDIMDQQEQFEAWYVALNPRAVVPTLQVGPDEIVTDTIRIVTRLHTFEGPNIAGDPQTPDWLRDIMALHYGVLLYRKRLEPDGTAPQIVARGHHLVALKAKRPDLEGLLTDRLERNARFQRLLRDPDAVQTHLDATRALVDRMATRVSEVPYLGGATWSVADAFGTAALARFTLHGFAEWWADTALADYYARMKARPSFTTAEVVDEGTERDL
ncbi:MAG: glutathione S-transferase family protein [Myxococcota bacterium]